MDGAHLLINLLEGRSDKVCLADIALPCLDLCAVLFGQLGGNVLGVL